MKSQEANKIIAKLPDAPGVYVFRGRPERSGDLGKPLYIGKATSLRDRVRSYFREDIVETRSPLISKMLSQFDVIEHIQTDSVLEALVLEANLIKKYQPEANIKEKDNRSFNFVVITKEDFPIVKVVRERELENLVSHHSSKSTPYFSAEKSSRSRADALRKPFFETIAKQDFSVAYTFGPFPSGGQLREAMKIVRKMFPYRDEKCKAGSGKPCFNRQIGLCPGVCTGEITQEEYAKQIQNIVLFFEGHKKRLIKNLEKQMGDFARAKEFEKAQALKKTIFTLSHIQDISLIKDDVSKRHFDTGFRIESYDIAHLSGTNVVGVMTVVEDGEVKKSDYRKFKIQTAKVDDTKALTEMLIRRLAHIEWRLPDLVVVDGGTAQKRAMEKVLRKNITQHGQKIPVVSVVKDERHRPREILGDKSFLIHERAILLSNAEAHRFAITFHRSLRRKSLTA